MGAALGELTWPQLSHRPLLAVPLGSCEQHGPHLPLDTDTRIAVALAERLAAVHRPGEIVVAPPVTVSASGEHAGFPGTLSVGTGVAAAMVVELVRSADWASGVVLVNGHGGNAEAVRSAVDTLTAEGRRVLSWWPRVAGGDAHAGHTETSLMLVLAPHLVRSGRAEAGPTEPLAELLPELRRSGVRGTSANGVLGDPRQATASAGRALLSRLAGDLVAAVAAWRD